MKKYTHQELKALALQDPETKNAYEALDEEFSLLIARIRSGKTQEDVAKIMHTSKSAISRLENSSGRSKHSPSLETLKKYASALGCELKIQLIPKHG